MTDQAGALTFTQSYDPYSVVTYTDGTSQTEYGFTGEQHGDSTQLLYLRARHYSPADGRFTSRDKWGEDSNIPMTYNKWSYTLSNPINLTDPSGNSIYSGICMGHVFTNGYLLNVSAKRLVEICKDFYSPSYWKNFGVAGIGPFDCASETIWRKPTTAGELFKDYICETGPDHVKFFGRDILTAKLARSRILGKIRREYYSGMGKYPYEEKFGSISAYVLEWADLVVDREFPLVHVIGSFDVSVRANGNGRVVFWAHNRTDLASGTHFVGRFPLDGQGDNPLTLEEVIDNNSEIGNQPAWWVINTHNDDYRGEIVAILRPVARDFTGPGIGGGNYEQTFMWSEKDINCEIRFLPWPIYLQLLDIDY